MSYLLYCTHQATTSGERKKQCCCHAVHEESYPETRIRGLSQFFGENDWCEPVRTQEPQPVEGYYYDEIAEGVVYPAKLHLEQGVTDKDFAYHLDALGSVRLLSDSSKDTAVSYTYLPYGESTLSSGTDSDAEKTDTASPPVSSNKPTSPTTAHDIMLTEWGGS